MEHDDIDMHGSLLFAFIRISRTRSSSTSDWLDRRSRRSLRPREDRLRCGPIQTRRNCRDRASQLVSHSSKKKGTAAHMRRSLCSSSSGTEGRVVCRDFRRWRSSTCVCRTALISASPLGLSGTDRTHGFFARRRGGSCSFVLSRPCRLGGFSHRRQDLLELSMKQVSRVPKEL